MNPRPETEALMTILTRTETVGPLRQRMIEDMNARKLGPASQPTTSRAGSLGSAAFGSPGSFTRGGSLDTGEFIRRFMMHVLPRGFHRIRRTEFLPRWHQFDSIRTA